MVSYGLRGSVNEIGNIPTCAGPVSYGTDEAGSVWWSPSVGVWKLHKYKE